MLHCKNCERPLSLCECLGPYHMKARAISLRGRTDLKKHGCEGYKYAVAVNTFNQKGEVIEYLSPCTTAENASTWANWLNSADVVGDVFSNYGG